MSLLQYRTASRTRLGLPRSHFGGGRRPMFHPHPRRVLTTLGVIEIVRGILMKMKDLCIAYASANCVQRPIESLAYAP